MRHTFEPDVLKILDVCVVRGDKLRFRLNQDGCEVAVEAEGAKTRMIRRRQLARALKRLTNILAVKK